MMTSMLDKFNVGYVSKLDKETETFKDVNKSGSVNIGNFIIRTEFNNSEGEIEFEETFNFSLLNETVYNKYEDNIDEHFCETLPPDYRPADMRMGNEDGWITEDEGGEGGANGTAGMDPGGAPAADGAAESALVPDFTGGTDAGAASTRSYGLALLVALAHALDLQST
jgi:hypothetical protein